MTKNDVPLFLTNKEFEILKTLVISNEKVFTKKDLYRLVWNEDGIEIDNVINVYINRLRTKIGDDSKHPAIIKTVWGFGYKIGVDVFKVET